MESLDDTLDRIEQKITKLVVQYDAARTKIETERRKVEELNYALESLLVNARKKKMGEVGMTVHVTFTNGEYKRMLDLIHNTRAPQKKEL